MAHKQCFRSPLYHDFCRVRDLARPKELSLHEQIKQAKLRAQALDLAHDAKEWNGLLHSLKLTEITNAAELAVVNGHMTAIEKGVVVATK